MFWNKKESGKGLPDLPPAKIAQPSVSASFEEESDDDPTERHGLPSFPDSPMQKGFSQTAIKDAVTHPDVQDEMEIITPPKDERTFKTVELDEWSSEQQKIPPSIAQRITSLSSTSVPQKQEFAPQATTPIMQISPRGLKNTDIFVKIDKFYSARKALETASTKLDEIDELLKKIRETKMREEQELNTWEKDITTIKARLKDVTETIFEKVE